MATDLIRYDLLVQDALKGVIRRVLSDAARNGLPGDHHFYVSFRTDKSGVRISARLRERYPQDMTIVLQHQFSGLTVNEQFFEVGLSFSGVPERLRIPFDALTGFFDPSVQFGLKIEGQDEAAPSTEEAPAPVTALPSAVPQIGSRKKPDGQVPAEPAVPVAEATSAVPAEEGSAEVVSLDKFRRKT